MITVVSSSRFKIDRKKIRGFASDMLAAAYQNQNVNLNLVFVGKNKMKSMAAKYKQENVALPVLSFPYNENQEGEKLIGEVFICYPQAVLLAAERSKKVDDIILQLVKHGIDNLLK